MTHLSLLVKQVLADRSVEKAFPLWEINLRLLGGLLLPELPDRVTTHHKDFKMRTIDFFRECLRRARTQKSIFPVHITCRLFKLGVARVIILRESVCVGGCGSECRLSDSVLCASSVSVYVGETESSRPF